MNKFFFDGKITDSISDVNVLNRGFKYNDSFFETIHVSNGKVFNIKNHLYRIKKAKDILKFNFKYNDNQLTKIFNDLISVNNLRHAVLRFYVFRNSDGLYLPKKNQTSLIIHVNHLNHSFKLNPTKTLCVYSNDFKLESLLSNISFNKDITNTIDITIIGLKNIAHINAIILP